MLKAESHLKGMLKNLYKLADSVGIGLLEIIVYADFYLDGGGFYSQIMNLALITIEIIIKLQLNERVP